MSELDDAIREHLELKRRHGARDTELKELEDEAFGTGERPLDPFKASAEAAIGGESAEDVLDDDKEPGGDADAPVDKSDSEAGDPDSRVATPKAPEPGGSAGEAEQPPDLMPDEAAVDEAGADDTSATAPPPPSDTPIPPPPPPPDRDSEVVHQPTEEHPPPEPPSEELAEAAEEFEADFGAGPAEPEPSSEPAAEEPAADDAAGGMLYDFEADMASALDPEPAGETEAPPERPPLESPATETELEEDFENRPPLPDPDSDDAFSDLGPAEKGSGGGELAADDDDLPPEEALSHDGEGDEEGPGAVTADTSEREALEPTEQYTLPAEDEPAPQFEEEPEDDDEGGAEPGKEGDEDVLEETPDFLEEKPDGEDDLWFEKKPPKDFDFEDE